MYIIYDEYELLELFEAEPKLKRTEGEEAGLFMYSNVDKHSIKLLISFSVYENQCDVSLSYNRSDGRDDDLFDCRVENVERFECKKNQMNIIKFGGEVIMKIYFKPYYVIEMATL